MTSFRPMYHEESKPNCCYLCCYYYLHMYMYAMFDKGIENTKYTGGGGGGGAGGRA